MRTKLRGKITLLFMTFALVLAIPAIALADQLGNDLDTDALDANFEQISFTEGDSAQTVTLALFSQGAGPERNLTTPSAPNSPVVVEGGCNVGNLSPSDPEGEIEVQAISSGSAASVKWAATGTDKVKFAACSDLQMRALTVTPGTVDDESTAGTDEGTANVTFKITSTGFTELASPNTGIWQEPDGSGRYDLNTARFTVNVTPPPNTPPSVSVTGVEHGATYDKGAVPAAGCSVSDAEDTGESATPQVVTPSLLDSDGLGLETVRCSYTDGGGLTTTASATYTIRDPSPPVITKTVTGQQGNNGWYTSNVSVDWTVTEPQSPNSLQLTGCEDQNITTDQAATTYSCSATSAGGSAPEQSVTIKRDATAPTISGTPSPAANSFGWNNTAVTVSYSCDDNLSGVDGTCGPDETLSNQNAGQSSTGSVTDAAGNTANTTVNNINIDLTNPLVSLVGGPANGSSHYFGSVPGAPTCNASDALSGLDGACSVSGYSALVGHHTVKAEAKDKAANTASDSHTYDVLAWTFNGFYQPVDMLDGEGKPVVNTVKGGSTVPFKFELFAGPTELTSTSDVKTLKSSPIACSSLPPTVDAIELTATGGTSLRYDTTGGQFVYNWKTPTGAGTCHAVTVTAQDGSYKTAYFKLK